MIRYNPFCPSPDLETKDYSQSKNADNLIKEFGEITALPTINGQNLHRDFDVCMKCAKAVINLKSHFQQHIAKEECDAEQFVDYLLWSRAKKMQLVLFPSISIVEIKDMMQRNDVNGLVDAFSMRGITVVNEEEKFTQFEAGDHILGLEVPSSDGLRLPSTCKKIIPEQYKTQRAFMASIELGKKVLFSEAKSENLNLEVIQTLPGTLMNSLCFFKSTSEEFFPYAPISMKVRRDIANQFFKSVNIDAMSTKFFRKISTKGLDKIPMLSTLDEKVELQLEKMPFIAKENLQEEQMMVMGFYLALSLAIIGPKKEKALTDAQSQECVQKLAKAMRVVIDENIEMTPEVLERYTDHATHLEDLKKGEPKKIFSWELNWLAEMLGMNFLFAVQSDTENVTVAIPGSSTEEEIDIDSFKADGKFLPTIPFGLSLGNPTEIWIIRSFK